MPKDKICHVAALNVCSPGRCRSLLSTPMRVFVKGWDSLKGFVAARAHRYMWHILPLYFALSYLYVLGDESGAAEGIYHFNLLYKYVLYMSLRRRVRFGASEGITSRASVSLSVFSEECIVYIRSWKLREMTHISLKKNYFWKLKFEKNWKLKIIEIWKLKSRSIPSLYLILQTAMTVTASDFKTCIATLCL